MNVCVNGLTKNAIRGFEIVFDFFTIDVINQKYYFIFIVVKKKNNSKLTKESFCNAIRLKIVFYFQYRKILIKKGLSWTGIIFEVR